MPQAEGLVWQSPTAGQKRLGFSGSLRAYLKIHSVNLLPAKRIANGQYDPIGLLSRTLFTHQPVPILPRIQPHMELIFSLWKRPGQRQYMSLHNQIPRLQILRCGIKAIVLAYYCAVLVKPMDE